MDRVKKSENPYVLAFNNMDEYLNWRKDDEKQQELREALDRLAKKIDEEIKFRRENYLLTP